MKLVDRCLVSEALKRKLQGLNELKDIIKSLTYSSERNKTIVKPFLFRKSGSVSRNFLKKFTLPTAMCSSLKNPKTSFVF